MSELTDWLTTMIDEYEAKRDEVIKDNFSTSRKVALVYEAKRTAFTQALEKVREIEVQGEVVNSYHA
jgi:hypothetical protein